VSPESAIIIGAVCGTAMVFSVEFIERVLKIDDPVGASSVHAVCGFLGTVMTGLFAIDGGLFYGGGAGLVLAQLTGAVTIGLWAFGMGYVIFKVLDVAFGGLRVSKRVEEEGLDIYEHGETAYN
jgi:Amt family ammonium transporter